MAQVHHRSSSRSSRGRLCPTGYQMQCDAGRKDKRSGLIGAKGGNEKALWRCCCTMLSMQKLQRLSWRCSCVLLSSQREQNLHIYLWRGRCPPHCGVTHLRFVWWNVYENKSLEMSQALSSSDVPLNAEENCRCEMKMRNTRTCSIAKDWKNIQELCRKRQSAGCCCSTQILQRY